MNIAQAVRWTCDYQTVKIEDEDLKFRNPYHMSDHLQNWNASRLFIRWDSFLFLMRFWPGEMKRL